MKALILTGKLATWEEYIYAYHRLQEAGAEVDVAVRGKETVYGELKGPAGLVQAGPIVPTRDIPELIEWDAGRYDLLILPGGAKAMEYLRQDKQVLDYIAAFHKAGGVIGSICHAAQLLISSGLVKGRRISGYYSIKDDITNAGGTFVDRVVVEDRIVTAPHYKFNAIWMKCALEVTEGNHGY
jgi:protease I